MSNKTSYKPLDVFVLQMYIDLKRQQKNINQQLKDIEKDALEEALCIFKSSGNDIKSIELDNAVVRIKSLNFLDKEDPKVISLMKDIEKEKEKLYNENIDDIIKITKEISELEKKLVNLQRSPRLNDLEKQLKSLEKQKYSMAVYL